jgi:hypothetical protein
LKRQNLNMSPFGVPLAASNSGKPTNESSAGCQVEIADLRNQDRTVHILPLTDLYGVHEEGDC